MTGRRDYIRLGLFMSAAGDHSSAWRHPDTPRDAGSNLKFAISIAQAAEKACFDMLFIADTMTANIDEANREVESYRGGATRFEPITLLSALAGQTSHIGLVATATTTYFEPFILARQFASLDLLSGGRAGWNVVTSVMAEEAANFGREVHPDPARRYARASEFVDIVKGLWESWEDDALIADKDTGQYYDPDKLHFLNYAGEHFSVAGPLHVPRSPQGHPVVVQAGSSEPGKMLAARTAEVVFAAHATIDGAQSLYADIKGRMAAFGRSPDALKIMPGLLPIIGSTEAEARAKRRQLDELFHPEVARRYLVQTFQCPELLDYPLDESVPSWLEEKAAWSRGKLLVEIARREGLTLRELAPRLMFGRGHNLVVGTPEQIVHEMETWFDGLAADGFNIMVAQYPGGLTDFIDHVMPELRRRGRIRTEYTGTTLRENLGLPYPIHPAVARSLETTAE